MEKEGRNQDEAWQVEDLSAHLARSTGSPRAMGASRAPPRAEVLSSGLREAWEEYGL